MMKSWLKYFVLLFCLKYIEGSFRCDYKYNSKANGWFKHHVVPATWYDARMRCTLEGAALASPTTPEITKQMTHIIRNFLPTQSEIFTGISARISQGDFFTVEGIPLSEFSLTWAYNEPDNKDNDENCITLNGRGEILDKSCAVTRPYICYRSENSESLNFEKAHKCGTVDTGYRLDTRTNSCYKFHAIPRNYSRANFACSAEGGHLAIINSEIEAQVLKELFDKHPANVIAGNFWKDIAFVGFYALDESFDWVTVHGQSLWELWYHKFSGGEPDNSSPGQYCGAIYRTGLLSDLWCDRPAAYICEKNPNSIGVCEAVPDEDTETEATIRCKTTI